MILMMNSRQLVTKMRNIEGIDDCVGIGKVGKQRSMEGTQVEDQVVCTNTASVPTYSLGSIGPSLLPMGQVTSSESINCS